MIELIADGCILVVCDSAEYDSDHVLQIVSKARVLADKSLKKVTVLCIGSYAEGKFKNLIGYGADQVILYESENVHNIRLISEIASDVVKEYQAQVVLVPASFTGKSVAALLSTKLDAGLTADCIEIDVDENDVFSFSRAALNDSVIAKIQCINCDIKMCTVKKGVFSKIPYESANEGEIIRFQWKKKTEYAEEETLGSKDCEKEEEIDVNKYSIVFCIGRGVKKPETREKIAKLAECLHAGVIGTRAVVEDYNMSKARQVGQSGKSISPKIYVGFGVSGASQHMVGIKRAEFVIAVNTDKNAPIFDYADYSIVEDVEEFVQILEKKMEKENELCGF